jgi:hypothetical protein
VCFRKASEYACLLAGGTGVWCGCASCRSAIPNRENPKREK